MIQFENRGFSTETIHALKKRGHGVKFRNALGEANCIQFKDGYFFGSADSRRNASAAGY